MIQSNQTINMLLNQSKHYNLSNQYIKTRYNTKQYVMKPQIQPSNQPVGAHKGNTFTAKNEGEKKLNEFHLTSEKINLQSLILYMTFRAQKKEKMRGKRI